MTLPTTFTYGTVTGKFLFAVASSTPDTDPDGVPVQGNVVFTPVLSTNVFLSTGSTPPATVLPQPFSFPLDNTGSFEAVIPATDDPSLNPVDWSYEVSFDFIGTTYASFIMQLATGATVDITEVTPLPGPQPGIIYLKGDKGDQGLPGIGVQPTGTPEGYTPSIIGGVITWGPDGYDSDDWD